MFRGCCPHLQIRTIGYTINMRKVKFIFEPWTFYPVMKSHGGDKCQKCKELIKKGEMIRNKGKKSNHKYHLKCVAFISSRYHDVVVLEPTPEDIKWKKWFDIDVSAYKKLSTEMTPEELAIYERLEYDKEVKAENKK